MNWLFIYWVLIRSEHLILFCSFVCGSQSQRQWERANVDLEAERRRLQEQWQEASAIRESLVKEAATMKAMGTLVQVIVVAHDGRIISAMTIQALRLPQNRDTLPMT